VAWLSAYVIIGCMIALISLICTKPEKLSLSGFALSHALWPVSLAMIVLIAAFSSRRNRRSKH
jgi:hypothetical protein